MVTDLLNKKVKYWEDSLLDVGKRNNMMNYHETKRTTIKLTEPGAEELFDRLVVNGETLSFKRLSQKESDMRINSVLDLMEILGEPLPLGVGDIRSNLTAVESQKTLKNIRNKARGIIEEQGINMLCVSIGFVEWEDVRGATPSKCKSPLILVPVTLGLKSINAPYTLSKTDEDIVVNPTVSYYWKTAYGIELPSFDEHNESIASYFQKIETIAEENGWTVKREASVGFFSFLKINMYHDLLNNEDKIKQHPVIKALAGDLEEVNNIPEDIMSIKLDGKHPSDSYQVLSADSSQQEALHYARNGVNFSLEGPPGSGKSQTIANMIAEAIADGKTVLFVSGKMAALQVVYRRLEEAKLADFCLPLHNYRANKNEVLQQIGANLDLQAVSMKKSALGSLDELEGVRNSLNEYANDLHNSNTKLGMSCYEVYGELEALKDVPVVIFDIDDLCQVSGARLQKYLKDIKDYSLVLKRIENRTTDNPWLGCKKQNGTYEYNEKLRDALNSAMDYSEKCKQGVEALTGDSSLSDLITMPEIADVVGAIDTITLLPSLSGENIADLNTRKSSELVKRARKVFGIRKENDETISGVFAGDADTSVCMASKAEIDKACDTLMKTHLFKNVDKNILMNDSQEFLNKLSSVKAGAEAYISAVDTAEELVGLSFTNIESAVEQIKAISELLSGVGKNFNTEWFNVVVDNAEQKVLSLRDLYLQMSDLKEQIGANWSESVFDEQSDIYKGCERMKKLFERDYNSSIRFINREYYIHKKLVEEACIDRTVASDNNEVVKLLSVIAEYKELKAAFNKSKSLLEESFADFFTANDIDWESLIDAAKLTDCVSALYGKKHCSVFADCVSDNVQSFSKQLKRVVEQLTESYHKLEAISADDTLAISFDRILDSYDEELQVIDMCIESLSTITGEFDKLSAYLRDEDCDNAKIVDALNKIKETEALDNEIGGINNDCRSIFNELYNGEDTDWNKLDSCLAGLRNIKNGRFAALLECYSQADEDKKNEIKAAAADLKTLVADKSAEAKCKWFAGQFEGDIFNEFTVSRFAKKTRDCCENNEMRQSWMDYLDVKEKTAENGISDFIRAIEEEGIVENIDKCFLKGFYNMWLNEMSQKLNSIRGFRRNVQDERISSFAELDDLQLHINRGRIREKLIAKLPSSNRLLKATDEIAILNKELSKKKRVMPLRKLFGLIPNLLLQLKPCFMMSPLSVSYFLDADKFHFDLVIFDEASQIFPEDAIGAILRGSQVVIAGDSKQLPPTDFFNAAIHPAEEYDVDEDEADDEYSIVSDSILEEASAVLPGRTLLWHYRSKSESLIAFSNHEVYNNRLVTFPDSVLDVPDMGVEYCYVEDGIYEGGGKNCNIREAEKCVELIEEHIQKYPDRSLGVIAFSIKQQDAIEEAVNAFRVKNPQYEEFFDESREEPFFIKNLENVQGDERDTIIFSICYGKDKNGKMYMRFGPVGKQGGERRLNVAVTRAKCNVKLVGSIMPGDIKLENTRSEGVRLLRDYISYAMNGTKELWKKDTGNEFNSSDCFVDMVCDFLEANGYSFDKYVGCSGNRVDIAVKNPANDKEYIAGIDCDGSSYVKAKTTRDRDHLRSKILGNMGWNLYRVWSTEWVRNPRTEGENLLAYLRSVVDEEGNVIRSIKQSNNESGDSTLMYSLFSEGDVNNERDYVSLTFKHEEVHNDINSENEKISGGTRKFAIRKSEEKPEAEEFSVDNLTKAVIAILEDKGNVNFNTLESTLAGKFKGVKAKVMEDAIYEAIASLMDTGKVKVADNTIIYKG